MRRLLTVLTLLLVAVVLFSHTTYAGGWATITFDKIAANVHAGEPTTVRFVVRQHGNNPVHAAFGQQIIPTVHLRNNTDGKAALFPATPDEEVGYYNADVTFPTQGDYEMWVSLSVLQVDEKMTFPVTVLAAQPLVAAEKVDTLVAGTTSAPSTPSMGMLVALLGMGMLAVAGISVWVLRRS